MVGDLRDSRWIIVVKRDQQDLYQGLREIFAGDSRVEIILDRRYREPEPPPEEVRSPRQRRRPLTAREAELWDELGLLLARRVRDATPHGTPDPERTPRAPEP